MNSHKPESLSAGGSKQDSEQPQQSPDSLTARLTNFLFAAFQSKIKCPPPACDDVGELIPCGE